MGTTFGIPMRHENYMKNRMKDDDEFGFQASQQSDNPVREIDLVNSPPHYNQGDIECIDAIESALGAEGFAAYCRGSAIKYLWRAELKHPDNKDDWAKANWFINRATQSGER